MTEKLSHKESISEEEIGGLRQNLDAAEAEVARIKEERDRVIKSIMAGEKGAAHNFEDYLKRLRDAEQKAIVALEAWGSAVTKFYKLED